LRTLDPTWFDIIANDVKIIENRKILWSDVYSLTAKNLYSYEVFGPLNEFNVFTQNKVTETLIFLTDDFFKHTTLTKIKESAVKAANSDILTLLDQLLKSHAKPTTFFNSSLVLGVVAIVAVVAIAAAFIYFSKVPSTSDITELSKNIDDDISSINTNLTELKTTITNVETGLDLNKTSIAENATILDNKINESLSELTGLKTALTDSNNKIDLNKTSIAENFTILDNKINESVVDLPTLKTTVTNMDGALKYNTKKITENFTTLDNKINEGLEELQQKLSRARTDIDTGLETSGSNLANLKTELLKKIGKDVDGVNKSIEKTLDQVQDAINDLAKTSAGLDSKVNAITTTNGFNEVVTKAVAFKRDLDSCKARIDTIEPQLDVLIRRSQNLTEIVHSPSNQTLKNITDNMSQSLTINERLVALQGKQIQELKTTLISVKRCLVSANYNIKNSNNSRIQKLENYVDILLKSAPSEVQDAAKALKKPANEQLAGGPSLDLYLQALEEIIKVWSS
jgi:F0F1-type ATP synthase membrane subunit b/b'